MGDTVPNIQLRAWRNAQELTRDEMAERLNRTRTGLAERLSCDAKRIERWETGQVGWPREHYRHALQELTGKDVHDLGFSPRRKQDSELLASRVRPQDALRTEAELFDTMELARLADASDVGIGTIEAVQEAVELLCRAYPSTPADVLRSRTQHRLKYVLGLVSGRVTLDQMRELLVQAGWLYALLGCLHYDLGEREPAETARQAAYSTGKQTGHGELMGWAHEMSAWFALTEGRYEDVVEASQQGQSVAGTSSAMVQLALQEAKGHARLGKAKEANEALTRGAAILAQLPTPSHPDNHFVFDHTKWIFYAATIYTWQGDDDRAEEHAQEIITRHTRPDGSTNAPMRVANARIDLGIIHARRGDLDAAVSEGLEAFDFDRRSLTDLVVRGNDLDRVLRKRYRHEALAKEFHDRLVVAKRALNNHQPHLLD